MTDYDKFDKVAEGVYILKPDARDKLVEAVELAVIIPTVAELFHIRVSREYDLEHAGDREFVMQLIDHLTMPVKGSPNLRVFDDSSLISHEGEEFPKFHVINSGLI